MRVRPNAYIQSDLSLGRAFIFEIAGPEKIKNSGFGSKKYNNHLLTLFAKSDFQHEWTVPTS